MTAVVLGSVCAISAQYQLKRLVDAMSAPDRATRGVWLAFGAFIVLLALESGLLRLSAVLTCRLTIKIGVAMRLDLFDYLAGQSMRYFADNPAGALAQRITGTAGNFGALVNTAVWRLVPPFIDFAGALAVFCLINWRMAMAMGLYVLAVTVALIIIGGRGRALHAGYFRNASVIAGDLIDVVANMWAVKAYSAKREESERLGAGFVHEAASQRASWMYTEKTRMAYDALLWIMSALMLIWALYSWEQGSLTPGDVVVISALTFRVLHGARELALALVDVSQNIGFIDDTLQTLGRMHSVTDRSGSLTVVPSRGEIEFRNVRFGYDAHRPILPCMSFHIKRGEKVGIVGASGSGKSTIIQLIQRLHDVQAGEVLVDGEPVTRFTQKALRDALAVVPQEISLFHRSVLENIRFARSGATDAEVIEAAAAACCDEFIDSLPQGFDTTVGERGVKLSGGQRQRVGIARAFLKSAPIVLMDEATSALDTALELRIHGSIDRRLQGRTIIAVAHRLSTLSSFDRVLVMHEGKIVEEGSPAELRRGGTLFNQLWRLQTHGVRLQAPEVRRTASTS